MALHNIPRDVLFEKNEGYDESIEGKDGIAFSAKIAGNTGTPKVPDKNKIGKTIEQSGVNLKVSNSKPTEATGGEAKPTGKIGS